MPVSYVLIDTKQAARNMRILRQHFPSSVQMMAVVKNDAYGNGAVKMAQLALANGFTHIGVARVSEGMELRENCITAPIMVLGLVPEEELPAAIAGDFLIPVDNVSTLRQLDKLAAHRVQVMAAVDTGLHRIGMAPEEMGPFLREVKRYPHISLKGIYTHFIEAELADKTRTYEQLARFREALSQASDTAELLISSADSAAAEDVPESRFNLVRIGALLTGIQPSEEMLHPLPVAPILSLVSQVVHTEIIRKGETVGYGGMFRAPRDMTIATVPIGYGDGYRRTLSGKASVLIGGKKRRITGLICMDQMMVEADETVHPGDPVVLIGRQGQEEILAADLARLCDANVHEFLGGFRRLTKVYR